MIVYPLLGHFGKIILPQVLFQVFSWGCLINPSNYVALEGILYCKHHFSQLFKEKGSYNHLIKTASMKRAAAVPEVASAVPEI